MLILSRKKGESIIINNNIEIVITSIEGDQVKLGINAPSDIDIFRKEVLDAIQQSNREAAKVDLNLEQVKEMIKFPKKSIKNNIEKEIKKD
jgi:carbon storage regulator